MLGLAEVFPLEVLVVERVGDLDGADVQLSLGGDHVQLVDPAEGAAVNVEGT